MKRLINTSKIIKRTILAAVTAATFLTSVNLSTLEAHACTNMVANVGILQAVVEGNNIFSYEGGGTDAVSRAQRWVGRAEYIWGACSPGEFDACGFVSYCVTGCYRRMGTTYTFLSWPQTSNPQPGDVCVSRGHCGIYAGDGMMIHAACEGQGVRIDPVHEGMIFVRSPY